MAKRTIVWSHRANIKLFEILDFYAERNKSKTYSKKLYKKLKKEASLLLKQPEIGIKTDYESIRGLMNIFYSTKLHQRLLLFIQYGIADKILMI